MLVEDRTESQYLGIATIGTSGCRLSSEPCGHALNKRERSASVFGKKPVYICSRVRRKASQYFHGDVSHIPVALGISQVWREPPSSEGFALC
jgi:hypothetical protein